MDFFRTLTFVSIILIPFQALAVDADIENDLQKDLQQGKVILERAEAKLKTNRPPDAEIKALKAKLQDIKASHLLLQERFREREAATDVLGAKAAERQRKMSEGYSKALEEYINLIESLPTESRQQTVDSRQEIIIKNLKTLLDGILHKKKRPILGSLPYRRLNYPAIEPVSEPTIKPAYKGGNKQVSPDDLKSAPEAPITEEIAGLAQSLNWNPVLIYEHVKNNIETEWYWGCMKGAEETLRQGSGNDCDQAALLTALLRASGFPTRYVRGTIEFFAGRDAPIEKIKNLTGIKDPLKIAEFFQKAGIPYKPVITGGQITNFRIEHIWTESQIPYANYRGAIIDEHGKTWLGLDTSIKVTGYEYNEPVDIFSEEPAISEQLSALRDEYLAAIRVETPIEYIRAFLNSQLATRNPKPSYDDLLTTRKLIPEVMNILPASMQFVQKAITAEYTQIPEELMHKVRFMASRQDTADSIEGDNLFDITIDTMKLSNKPIAITYEPETIEDREIINSYGGLDNTPSYLVRLRPVLTVNGERIVVAKDGLPMGAEYELAIELRVAGSELAGSEKTTNTMIVGNLTAIGIVAQKTVQNQKTVPSSEFKVQSEKTAEDLLFEEAMNYIDRWNQAEDELASLMHVVIARPVPAVAIVGGVIDVTYLLDTPHGFQWKGIFIDAALRAASSVACCELRVTGSKERQRLFMQLSALQGSILENRIFEEDLKVESISTAKLFQLATRNPQPVTEILTIDKTNIDAILPVLPFDDSIKEDMINAVNQSLELRTPNSELAFEDWTGIGYIKEDPGTGEAGYMLSGMIAGGMTVTAPEGWEDQELKEILSKPYTKEHNKDPLSAAKIIKLSGDRKYGTVGKPLPQPLAVLVIDRQGKPVAGAHVTFRVYMGGGNIKGQQTYTAATGISGKAEATLTLGKHTKDNAYYLKPDEKDKHPVQAGLNLVTAAVSSHSGEISIDQAFEAYGIPGLPEKIEKVFPRKETTVLANNPAGSMQAMVTDRYGNPVSNIDMKFEVKPAESRNPSVPLPEGRRNLKLYRQEQCKNPYPIYPECGEENYYSSVTIKTQYFGAVIEAVTGNTVNTKYTVRVTAAGLPPEEFTFYSDGYRDEGDYLPPGIYIRHLGIVNEKGEPVNAAKAGEDLKAPLAAGIFMLHDKYKMEGPYSCVISGSATDCWRIKATGIVDIQPITDGTIKYTPTEGGGEITSTENPGDGTYRATFKTGNTPAVNKIEAEGSATIKVPEVFYDPFTNKAVTEGYPGDKLAQRTVDLKSGQEVLFDRDTKEAIITTGYGKLLYTVYGVDVQLAIEPEIILLNERGYTNTDITFRYTILPVEYRAILADIDLYETDENNKETWIDYLNGDGTQGEGTATAIAGSRFDINRKYEAEAVLNRGTDMEIRSGKEIETEGEKEIQRTDIIIALIRVLNDENSIISETDEIKFSDGSKAKKRYHIELKSKLLTELEESCESLSGRLRIIDADGQTISTPGAEYYPPEYNLDFLLSGGKCLVRLKDTTSEAVKERFILSNLSGTALKARDTDLSNIMPLYGGIGNTIEIEINRAVKEADIETVGVIVIGIDGLRQDVLYPDKMDGDDFENVNAPEGNYYVNARNLAGLGQILTGDPAKSSTQQYIMLPKVTSVFPSITLASWASIFTGKMPGETGILGNEFFARDLVKNRTIPAMKNNPAGMVTLSPGAFPRNMWELQSLTPLSEKWEDSPQNNLLQASTVYEELQKNTGFMKYFSDRGGKPRVVVFQHYSRGADEWVNINWWDAVDFLQGQGVLPHIFLGVLGYGVEYGLDEIPGDKAEEWLNNNLLSGIWPFKKRNDKPFPGIFVLYFAGLDHEAHYAGMEGYREFFRKTTDDEIEDIVNWLKKYGEFDNKIFIITADHGHTAMPADYKVDITNPATGQVKTVTPETSCELILKKFDTFKVQAPELANNNLHIWELGEVLKLTGFLKGADGLDFAVMAPKEIASLYKQFPYGAKPDADSANIIAAFNGPMAHIYVKNRTDNSWNSPRMVEDIGYIAELLRLTLSEDKSPSNLSNLFPAGLFEKAIPITAGIKRLINSIDMILIRRGSNYEVFQGINSDGSDIVSTPLNNYTELSSSKYVMAVKRIDGMNNGKRSGDIVLIMKDDVDIPQGESIESHRYTTGVACKSWHGGLNRSDSYVPLILAYPGGNKVEIEKIMKDVSACPKGVCEGNWNTTDIIKEIIIRQYGEQ